MIQFNKNALFLGLFSVLSWSCTTPTTSADRSIASTRNFFPDDQAACTSFSDQISSNQQKVINEVMASHEHRLNHVLWHATRNSWSDLTAADKKAIQKLSPQWGKNAPVCPPPDVSKNASGEEFLLMHHQMVDTLRQALIADQQPCIAGWKELPEAKDPLWPVPTGDKNDSSKSDSTGKLMAAWMSHLDDPAYLKGKSLSYIGYLVEDSLHNNMHMRWAGKPAAHDDFSPLDHSFTSVSLLESSAYDDPQYNWLGNPYSAHVNPVFWKLHGWVDAVIPKWLAANGYKMISEDCSGKRGCYQWKTQWVGGMDHHSMKGMGASMGHDHGGPVLTPAEQDAANKAIQKIAGKAGFRNTKFDQFNQDAADGKGFPTATAGREDPMEDPATYVAKFGPCAP